MSLTYVSSGATRISFRGGGGGGVRALGAGPQVLRAPRFSLSAASVNPRYLLRVQCPWKGGDTTPWRLAPNWAWGDTLYVDIILRLQLQPQRLFLQPQCLLSIHNSFQIPDLAELIKLKSNTFFFCKSKTGIKCWNSQIKHVNLDWLAAQLGSAPVGSRFDSARL